MYNYYTCMLINDIASIVSTLRILLIEVITFITSLPIINSNLINLLRSVNGEAEGQKNRQ